MAKYEGSLEMPDPRPMAVPAHLRMPETLAETMKRLIRVELSRQAAAAGEETFEEADDFDVDGDDEISTPYELLPMTEETLPGAPLPAEHKKPKAIDNEGLTSPADGSEVQAGEKKEAEAKP